jgi:tripartite-type tricarboxylate transporter receptor subunit TctC
MRVYHRAPSALAGLVIAALPAVHAAAEDYPSRPITLVVPYAAGGGLDVLARTLAPRLSERLGKPVVVEDRPGYTIMLGTSSAFAINVTLNKSLPYDPAKDFAPIVLTSNAPFLMLVNPDLPVKSVPDLIKLAKEKPGQLSYGSAGPGSPQHLSMELFKMLTGTNLVHVPYRGDAPALTDLLAGHIQTQFAEPTPVLPLLKAGKVRALAVSSTARMGPAPDIPTVAEAGVPGFDFVSWQLVVAPAGTPKDIVDKLHNAFKAVLKLPEIQNEFATTGRIPVDSASPADLQKFVQSEIVRLGKVVEQAGIARSQ